MFGGNQTSKQTKKKLSECLKAQQSEK
jgi:hypothetical protein